MIHEMGEKEARDLLGSGRTGRLGCCAAGEPYVVPVNYLFDGECIYLHSLPGRKIQLLRANPRACLQVDEVKDDYHWRSVLAWGNYEELADVGEREVILADLFKRLPHLTPVESRMERGKPETIVFRLRVDRITGVCESW